MGFWSIVGLVWAVCGVVAYLWLLLDTLYYRADLASRWKAVKEAFTEE